MKRISAIDSLAEGCYYLIKYFALELTRKLFDHDGGNNILSSCSSKFQKFPELYSNIWEKRL